MTITSTAATPATAADFPGTDAATGTELARQFNQQLGVRAPTEPAAPAPEAKSYVAPRSVPLGPLQESMIDKAAEELRALNPSLDKATARTLAEQESRYRHGSSVERSELIAELELGRINEGFEASMDAAHAKPAKAPSDYLMPDPGKDPAAREFDAGMRSAMFSAGISIETGNSIAAEVNATAETLVSATGEQVEAFNDKQEQTLRELWGPQFDEKLERTRQFLREAGERNPMLRQVLENRPEFLGSWKVFQTLEQVASAQQRLLRGARR